MCKNMTKKMDFSTKSILYFEYKLLFLVHFFSIEEFVNCHIHMNAFWIDDMELIQEQAKRFSEQ